MEKRKRSWGAWSPQFLQPVGTLWSQEPSAAGHKPQGLPAERQPDATWSRQEGRVCNTQGINCTRDWSRGLAQWFSIESEFAPGGSSGIIWRHFSCHDLWMLLISSESRPGRLLNTPWCTGQVPPIKELTDPECQWYPAWEALTLNGSC